MLNAKNSQLATCEITRDPVAIICRGEWTVHGAKNVFEQIKQLKLPKQAEIKIQGKEITHMDTVGAFAFQQLFKRLENQHIKADRQAFHADHEKLLTSVAEQLASLEKKLADRTLERPKISWLAQRGMNAVHHAQQIIAFFSFIGEASIRGTKWLLQPQRILWKAMLYTVESMGYRALAIIGLLSFLIGVVLAYQMSLQLRNYGANIFIVNLLGVSILREFAPLVTAIILAGRSGAAFTAQIGTMQVNEEIDALRTMDVPPVEELVLQKILGLTIATPLLTIWSCITGVVGGMVVSKSMLSISYYDFLLRFQDVIAIKQLVLGMIKTPVFALIISCIGCFQGFRVEGSADSVGRQTTKSVVQSLFLIITADALFSILYSWYDL